MRYEISLELENEKIEEDAQIIVPKDNNTLEDIISIIDLETKNKIKHSALKM